ncbi:MAG: FliG C-terminal domain-containing protein [Pseudomonadota bacterium]
MADTEKKAPASPPRKRSPIVESMPAARRAAIVLTMLGKDTATKVLNRLDDASLGKITAELNHIPYLGRRELVEVIIDFMGDLREASGPYIEGREKARELAGTLVDERRAAAMPKVLTSETIEEDIIEDIDGDVWERLANRSSIHIGDYLSRLTPNLIAMILRKLPSVKCSDVLNVFNEDVLRKVMVYMIQPEKKDPALDAVVGRMVEMEFLNTRQGQSAENAEHLESIGEILSLVPSERRDNLVEFLRAEHAETLEHIQRSMFTIEAIPQILPRTSVPVVFREMDMDDSIKLVASLQGQFDDVAEHFLSNISARMADLIKDELRGVETMSDEEKEELHRAFIGKLMDLKRLGKIETVAKAS